MIPFNTAIEPELGKPASESALGVRDALHVPVIYARAHKNLSPGERVGVSAMQTRSGSTGIADPFREAMILAGEICAVLLPPKTTSSVRHVWEHPEISDEAENLAQEKELARVKERIERIQVGAHEAKERWERHAEEICLQLEISRVTLDDVIAHILSHGSGMGGPQPGVSRAAIDAIDWPSFWQIYNAAHGTKVGAGDPFCCAGDD